MGRENAPATLRGLFTESHVGQQLLKMADAPTEG